MKTLFLSVGDLSGDVHCAQLVTEILRRHPDWKIVALAGKNCEAAGAQLLADTSGLGVIGFASAMAILPRTLRLKRQAIGWARANHPDLAIVCDWGGFNVRMLPELKQLKIPALYYFPPRSWQKKAQVGLTIVPFCSGIATPFEWSARKLADAGATVEWVGHPILEKLAQLSPREELRQQFGIAPHEKMLVAMPGSRNMELRSIGPHVAVACQRLTRPGVKIFAAAPTGSGAKVKAIFPSHVTVVEGRTLDLLRAADAAIVKSGTSTLEAAAADCPQVVVYDVPVLLQAQVHLTGIRKKVPFVAMPNIIADREIVPELLGEKCRPPFIQQAVEPLLFESERADAMRQDYALVREALGAELPYTATSRTADMVDSLCGL